MQSKILVGIVIIIAVIIVATGAVFAYQYFTKSKPSISNAKVEQDLSINFTITWNSSGVDKVNIDLFNGKGVKIRAIAQGINNENKYIWSVEDLQAWRAWDGPSKIIISDTNNNLIKAETNPITISGAYPADNYDESVKWERYTNEKLGISFNYPGDWTYQEFSCNLDGVAFCPIKNGITGCGQTCGMDSSESPIYFYFDGWNNSKDKQKSFVLKDNGYKDIFDEMLNTFKFTK